MNKTWTRTGAAPLLLLSAYSPHSYDWSAKLEAFSCENKKTIVTEISLSISVSYPVQSMIMNNISPFQSGHFGVFQHSTEGNIKPVPHLSALCWGVCDLTWSLMARKPGANGEEPRAVRCD